jgi:hypothetical protein
MRRFLHLSQAVLSLGLVIGLAQVCGAYSLLTHEEVVDILWKDDIQPLLITRFPAATTEDLKKAHAFASGNRNFSPRDQHHSSRDDEGGPAGAKKRTGG